MENMRNAQHSTTQHNDDYVQSGVDCLANRIIISQSQQDALAVLLWWLSDIHAIKMCAPNVQTFDEWRMMGDEERERERTKVVI